MQFKEIAELIEILGRSSIEEFELERSGVRIRVKKPSPAAVPREAAQEQPAVSGLPAVPAAPEAKPPASKDDSLRIFKAPIVGTFYLTPKPDAEALVKVGDRVSKGTVICIIEAMKIFNQIESDIAGQIVRILVDNGRPVEYGEPLFEIRADA